MDIAKKLKEFNKRFDIQDNEDYEEEFQKFKVRVLNIFSRIDQSIKEEGIKEFCQILGIREKWEGHSYDFSGDRWSKNIIKSIIIENEEKKLYRLLQIIFYLPFKGHAKSTFYERLKEVIELSNINLSITLENDEVILYPKGEKEFDEKLVNEVLSFLDEKSHKHFVNALNSYQENRKDSSIKSAESLRRSLEEFLRLKFKNQKGLDKNIKALFTTLKANNTISELRNIIEKTFSYLDIFFNENSKHKDGNIGETENEFLIYQTGVLMRYVNKVV